MYLYLRYISKVSSPTLLNSQTTDEDTVTISPTNNSNVFGVHITADTESPESKTFKLLALFDAKRYGALCIESVPMCSKCLASCVKNAAQPRSIEMEGNVWVCC